MRLLVMFDLPTETADDLRKYRRLIKILEAEGFYRFQYSVFVRVCSGIGDVKAVRARLQSFVAVFPGDIEALSLTDKQFVSMFPLNWKTMTNKNGSLASSTKRMIVI